MRLSAADDREGCAGRSFGRLECLTSRRPGVQDGGRARRRRAMANQICLFQPRETHTITDSSMIISCIMTGNFRRAVPVATLGDGGMSGCGRHDGLSRSASRPPSPAGVGPDSTDFNIDLVIRLAAAAILSLTRASSTGAREGRSRWLPQRQ